MKRPYIICHMMMSLDGRIDCAMTEKIPGSKEYYETLASLEASTLLNGRVMAAMEMAGPGCFKAEHAVPVGKECVARHAAAAGYQVVLDSKGTLLWPDDDGAETPLLVILSEQAPQEYLAYLDGRHISWIVCGKDEVDLRRAVELLYSEFGVRRMTVAGGGTINGAFLDAGLLDEMSILIGPGIDGRKGMVSVFDGIPMDRGPVTLHLQDVQRYDDGAVWLRYTL